MTSRTGKKLTTKQLESCLQDLDDFEEPKVHLEQYATPPHIAALMLNTISMDYNDIEGKFVADLGCGTGRLSIGSLLSSAALVFGFDVDKAALEIAIQNVQDVYGEDSEMTPTKAYQSCEKFNFVQADIANPERDGFWERFSKKFDTVIMNPPFGTKNNEGLDMLFLKQAINLTDKVVYSLHKTSTRNHIAKKCQSWEVKGKPIAQIRYNLESTYKFHRKKSVDIDVDLWRIDCSSAAQII